MARNPLYTRPNKPLFTPVTRRERLGKLDLSTIPEPVAVDRFTECHVTPPDVAARMVEYLGPPGLGLTLEPSAGTGNLARALLAAGHRPAQTILVERHRELAVKLYNLALPPASLIVHRCFLEYAAERRETFSRIVMNPPFRDVRQHVKAAVSLLAPGGVLVALVPSTFERDDAETLETLGPETFASAKVHTKIIRIYGA